MGYFNKQKIFYGILCLLLFIITGIHILSWNSRAFTDWYRLCAFPVWTGIMGRISNLYSGSAGEILIAAGVCLAVAELVMLPVFFLEYAAGRRKKQADRQTGGKGNKRRAVRRFWIWNFRFVCLALAYIYASETLNCYILYHASTVEEQYFADEAEYGVQELLDTYTDVVIHANALSGQVKRDGQGQAVYDGTDAELYEACRKAMRAQGKEYPYLAGYYPDPKPIRASHFMSQQHLLGIYFPFTMEANYNTVMYPVNVPVTICHEFSHLKGIILEDEANYFGFAACTESQDLYLQYSGYLSVLGYLSRQIVKSVPEETRRGLVKANEQVVKDDVFLTKKQWEQVEKKAVLPTETVNKATNAFLDKNLTMNGVPEGVESYSQVVRLVIKYYEKHSG